MADPFSIATGAVQVAGAGIQLAKTLDEYLDCVKSARKHIKAIAVEVRLRTVFEKRAPFGDFGFSLGFMFNLLRLYILSNRLSIKELHFIEEKLSSRAMNTSF